MFLVRHIRNFYGRYERPISSFSLILGFVFDVFTLRRADTLFENLWILGYLLVIGLFIILIHLKETEAGGEKNPSSAHFWYVNILQFAFGGVFSAFLVLYFRSADIFVAWPFIAILAIIFIGNEFLKKHYIRLSFQISLYFLSIYWFAIFVIPVILRKIGPEIFLFSGLVSLILISLFIKLLFRLIKDRLEKSRKLITFLVLTIFTLVNVLYFTNWIPPIPLSLKDAGIYHSIKKNGEGSYVISYEDKSWKEYFSFYPDFKKMAQKSVYAFSAIFSPKGLDLTVLHEWQHYDEAQKKWKTEGIVNLPVLGGRDNGFRTYSVRSNMTSGKWRVNVKTEEGQIIGRLRFTIVPTEIEPALSTMVK